MPRDDADFAAYLAARWRALVRSLVLLGCPRAEADDVARCGMARCYAGWDRVRREEDVDVHVYGAVLDEWHRRRKKAGLDPEIRLADGWSEAAVLRVVAELDPAEVAEVLGAPYGAGDRVDGRVVEELRAAAEEIEVVVPPASDVVDEARTQRRRRRRFTTVGVTAAVLVIGGGTWATTRPAEPDLPPVKVIRSANPVDVAWYANGRLHLAGVALVLPHVTAMTALNGGAVYADRDGTVAFVAANGERRRLGHQEPDSRLVASVSDGWAAWVDPDLHGSRSLVVYDVGGGTVLGTRTVAADAVPVAIDQHRVYYQTSDAAYAWRPGPGGPTQLPQPGLADVESATRVYDVGESIDMVQPFFSVSFLRPGVGALLSPGGTFVITRAPGTEPGAPYEPLVYDVRSGKALPTSLPGGELAVDATFGGNDTVVYLVAHVGDAPDDLLILRSCDISEQACFDATPVRVGGGRALLSH